MKSIGLIVITFILSTAFVGDKTFPTLDLKSTEGKVVNLSQFVGKGKPTLVSFWATWCSPCKRELDAIGEIYPDWVEEYGINLVAISIDDARASAKIPGMVASKGWEYTVLVDMEQKYSQALGFPSIPQTYLLDGEGNIVYTHNGYSPGDEFDYEEKIKALVKK